MADRRDRNAARRPGERRAAVIVALAATVVGALAVAAYASLVEGEPADSAVTHKVGGDVRVAGSVEGLYPGAARKLRATVRNRSRHAVQIHRIGAAVRDASPACGRGNLRVKSLRHEVRLAPGERARVSLAVRMQAAAPDACEDAKFPLRFRTDYDRVRR